MNRMVFLAAAVVTAGLLVTGDGNAQVRKSAESLPATYGLTITRNGKTEKLTVNGAFSGGGVRFEADGAVTTGQSMFQQNQRKEGVWLPVNLSFPLSAANEYSVSVDMFPNTLAVSGIVIKVPRVETTLENTTFRSYRPGRPSFATVKFTIAPADHSIAQSWFQEVKEGRETRKDITINLLAGTKTLRKIILRGAIPVQWTAPDGGNETVEVQPERIELSGKPLTPFLDWLSSTVNGNEWSATVSCQLYKYRFIYQDAFLTGYSISMKKNDEVRETWSFQPDTVQGIL